jgi:hypothetical protein
MYYMPNPGKKGLRGLRGKIGKLTPVERIFEVGLSAPEKKSHQQINVDNCNAKQSLL